MAVHREQNVLQTGHNQAQALDFIHDQLLNGQKAQALTVVDVYTREALAIEVGQRLRGEHAIDVLDRLVLQRKAPNRLLADNGSEFIGHMVDLWACHHNVRIDFSRPGTPTDNAFIERFNGLLRDECLDVHWYGTLCEARNQIETSRNEYTASRPHAVLGYLTPAEYAAEATSSAPPKRVITVAG